jgi:hypothetical protein
MAANVLPFGFMKIGAVVTHPEHIGKATQLC